MRRKRALVITASSAQFLQGRVIPSTKGDFTTKSGSKVFLLKRVEQSGKLATRKSFLMTSASMYSLDPMACRVSVLASSVRRWGESARAVGHWWYDQVLRSMLAPRDGFREACGDDPLVRKVATCRHVLVPCSVGRADMGAPAPHVGAPGRNVDVRPPRPVAHHWRRDALLPCVMGESLSYMCSYL